MDRHDPSLPNRIESTVRFEFETNLEASLVPKLYAKLNDLQIRRRLTLFNDALVQLARL